MLGQNYNRQNLENMFLKLFLLFIYFVRKCGSHSVRTVSKEDDKLSTPFCWCGVEGDVGQKIAICRLLNLPKER